MKTFLITASKYAITASMLLAIVFSPLAPLVSIAQADSNKAITAAQNAAGATNQTLYPNGTTAAGTNTPNTPPTTTSDQMCVGGVGGCLANIIYVFTAGIGSAFAYVAAMFFNIAINISLNGPIYALTFVSTGWTTARDLANMAFLFILIYIAFIIMFGAETGGTMSLLAGVIAIALLVNFSFFFTRLVIDAGNILSIQFYNSIQAPSVASTAATVSAPGTAASVPGTVAGAVTTVTNAAAGVSGANTKDLTFSIMSVLNMQGLLNNNSFQQLSSQSSQWLTMFISLSFLYLAMGIIFWILTVVFVTAGIKFLMRVVVLWFLIIASPLAFVAFALPPKTSLHGYYKKWQDMLIAHAFYPVAFMFIFLILTNFCNQLSQGGNNNYISQMFTALNGVPTGISGVAITITQVAISLGFIIAILYIGLKASDQISVVGAKFAESAGNWAGRSLLRTYNAGYTRVGPGAWAGAADEKLKNSRIGNTALGYGLRRLVTKPMAGTTIPGSQGESYTKMKERQAKETAETAGNLRTIANRKAVTKTAKTIEDNIKAGRPADFGITTADKDRIQNLSKRELEAMSADEIKAIAPLLKESQIKLLEGIEKLTDAKRDDIKSAWGAESERAIGRKVGGAKAAIAAGTPVTDADKKKVQSLSKQEMDKMSVADLKQLVVAMSEDQKKKVDELDIPDADKEDIKNTWEEKAVDSPLQKSLKKIKDISGANASSPAVEHEIDREIATLKASPTPIVDGGFTTKIKTILETAHRDTTLEHMRSETEYRDASRIHTSSPTGVALRAAQATYSTAPTAANATALSIARIRHNAAPTATSVNLARAEASRTHAERQKTQEALDNFKDLEENRKKVESNAIINGSGTKGTFKASYL